MSNERAFYKSLGGIDQLFLINALKEEYTKAIEKYGEPVLISKNDIDYIFHYDGFVVLIMWLDLAYNDGYEQFVFNTI